MPSYALEYLDNRYPDDLQSKLDARCRAGWKVNTATIAFPYLHILWEHADSPAKDADPGRDEKSGASRATSA